MAHIICFLSSFRISHKMLQMKLVKSSSEDLINDKQWGRTALHLACARGDLELVACLLDHGANIDATDTHGWVNLFFSSSALLNQELS